MANVFMTGTNGFIGSHLAETLLQRGHDVTGMVRPTSDVRSLAPLFKTYGPRLKLVLGDLRDRDALLPFVRDADYVYHLGAVLMGSTEEEFRETNVEGTRNLLDAVQRGRNGKLQRFLYTSSQAAAGPTDNGVVIDETRPCQPVSWYGKSKADAEEIVKGYVEKGMRATVIRPVAVYGEREQDLTRGTFPAVKLGLSPRIGLKDKTTSFIYVQDLVRGMIAAAESPNSVGRTYFLSNPKPYRASEVINTIADAMDKKIRIPLITPHFVLGATAVGAQVAHEFARGRPLLTVDKVREVRHNSWAVTPAAAERDFGWKAEYDLHTGMRQTVRAWNEGHEAERKIVESEPTRDRAIKTYLLALAFGIVVEGIARLGNWYTFQPRWLIFVIIGVMFCGVMGTVTLLTSRKSILVQFLAGAAIGVGAEIANVLWLNAWVFNPGAPGAVADPWLRSLILGLPAGALPVLVNMIVTQMHHYQERVG